MELLEARKVQNNLEKAMDSIQDSLIVLELAETVRLKMENGKHYAALKVINAEDIALTPLIILMCLDKRKDSGPSANPTSEKCCSIRLC
jgi:hypothetical protein